MQRVETAAEAIADGLGSPIIRAAVYCRLSREGGRSVERQEQDGHRIAAERGWQVAAVFKEIASAGPHAKKARTEWNALLRAVEARGFDAVILWMEDRSARDVLAAGEFVKVCQSVGLTRLVLPSYEYDLSDPEEVAKFYGEIAAAQRELAKIVKRTKRAKLQQAENGEFNTGGKRAFGFTGKYIVKHDDGTKETVEVPLARALAEQDCIREAVERIIAGDSLRGICIDWNKRGILSALGEAWVNTSLRRMLLSPRIAGYRTHNGQLYEAHEYVDGEWQPVGPIVPRDKWEACRAILTDPARRTTMAGRQPKYLLVGLIFCGECGRPLRVRRMWGGKGGKRYPQYYCHDANGNCHHVYRDAARLESLILEALFRAVESQDAEDVAAGIQADDPTKPHYEALAALTALKDSLEDKFARDLISEPAYKRNMMRFEREEEQHWAAISRLKDDQVRAHVPKNLRELWPEYSLDRRRAILASVTERIEVHRLPHARVSDAVFADSIVWKLKPEAWQ